MFVPAITDFFPDKWTSRPVTTPWSRVFLEKLIVTQLVKTFSAFYGT
jgi:hypothetical protein